MECTQVEKTWNTENFVDISNICNYHWEQPESDPINIISNTSLNQVLFQK